MKYYKVWHGGYRILAVVKATRKRQAISKYVKDFKKKYSIDASDQEIKDALSVERVEFIDGVLSHGEMN